jgi:hypothetical protein
LVASRGCAVAVLGDVREFVGEQGRIGLGQHGRAHPDGVRSRGGAGAERVAVVCVVDPQRHRVGV